MMPRSFSAHSRAKSPAETLFGRNSDLALLRESVEQALAGSGGLVLVGGEAGIGKTALVGGLVRESSGLGARICTSACYDLMVTSPYRPWLDLLSGLATQDSPLPLPEDGLDGDASRPPSQDALLSRTLDFLVDAAGEQPTVAVLEDIHWADTASLDLLRYVARQLSDVPLVVVATYRDTELGRQNPLRQMLPVLIRESEATRVSLRPLDASGIRELVRDRYPLSRADELIVTSYLQKRAGGNPLFIRETLTTLEETGSILLTESGWKVGNLTNVPVPTLVRQVIEGRLSRLDDDSRTLLAVASVIGQDVPLTVWRDAAQATDDALSATIRLAIDGNLLEEVAAPVPLRFTHALVREALYFDLDLPQRRYWHGVVGEVLASRPSPDPDAVAYHFQAAVHEDAPVWLMIAGERAQKLYAWRAAAERFEAVLRFLGAEGTSQERRAWLTYRIGRLLVYSDPDRGIEFLKQAEDTAREIKNTYLAALAKADRGLLRCLVGDMRRGLTELSEGVASLDALPASETDSVKSGDQEDRETDWLSIRSIQRGALDLVGQSDGTHSRRGQLVFWLAWSGRYAEVVSMGEPFVRDLAEVPDGMQDALGDALAGLGHAYAALGRPDDALRSFARARETYQQIDHHFKVGNTAIYELSQAYLPYRADRLIEREWLAEQAEAG